MSVLRDYAATLAQPPLALSAETARYDEVFEPDGTFRPAWKGLAAQALTLTAPEVLRVDEEITRLLADDGVAYLHPRTGAHPWQLDPLPLVLDAATWAPLEVALAQRAELLDAILADVYGERALLREGVIPAAVVTGHSEYLRPLARSGAGDRHPLLLSAADLGRDAEGAWHVLRDRVQAPSGLGFAAENRRVISQVLPELLHESDLHPLDAYFAALRAALQSAAPGGASDARVVILSPGTLSETAFDQAFLATALGVPLVQGSDLVVRDGFVWMKPSRWPRTRPTDRVDVIVRRVDAPWCDPLELRGDSRLGVAGLAEAARRGNVRLLNGLGAGVLENPGLLPYLPAACEMLLGEQLRLPSVPTWWCGDEASRRLVLARLAAEDPTLVVRSIDAAGGALEHLPAPELAARIAAAPHRFAAQDLLPQSQMPALAAGRIDAQPLTLRTFALRYGSAYRPLLGGLAGMPDAAGGIPRSKDVWVLKASADERNQHLAEISSGPAARSIPPLPPRALSDMFWTGRYAERAEDLLRLMLAAGSELDEPRAQAAGAMPAAARVLLNGLGALAGVTSLDPDAEFRSLLLEARRPGSAAHSIARLREAMEGVRDQLSGDTWRIFANIDRAARALRSSAHPHSAVESAGRMLAAILSLYGVTANMIRDSGWHMIEAGRLLERGLQLCTLLAAGLAERAETQSVRETRALLDAMLLAAESIVTHRRRYRGSPRAADVLELLLCERTNPRSLAFAVAALRTHLGALPASTGSTRAERLLDDLESSLDAADVSALAALRNGRRAGLVAFLSQTSERLRQLSDALRQLHFEAGPPPLALSELSLIELAGQRG